MHSFYNTCCNMDVDLLINCVKKHIFLYDVSNKDYKNVSLKNAVWKSIGRELNQSADAVKKKWKSIRDGYTKYRKELKANGGNKKNISYIWGYQLGFLDSYCGMRTASSNAIEGNSAGAESSTQDSENEDSTPVHSPMPSPQSHEMLESTSQSSKRKRKDANNTSNKKQKSYDAIDYLFLSYADTFKKFPQREQAILKLELAKLFANTELGLLHSPNEQTSAYHYSNISSTEYQEINPLSFKAEN